ncbi:MAG: glycosyltransferase [Eisenbergiella sp.]
MKKIAFHLNCLARAGAERVVTNLSAQFAAEGYEVVIATEWREKEEYELDSRVRRVIVGPEGEEENRGRIARIWLRYAKLRRFVKEEKPDVLIAFGRKANYRALTATLFLKQKVVVCCRTNPTGHYDLLADRIQIPILFRKAAGFVFQTVGQRDASCPCAKEIDRTILNPAQSEI